MSTYAEKLAMAAKRARRYRAEHPERKKAANRRYYENHKWDVMTLNERWRAKNWKWISMQRKQREAGLSVTPIQELREQFP